MSHLFRHACWPPEQDEAAQLPYTIPRTMLHIVPPDAPPGHPANPDSCPREPGWHLASHVDAVLDCLADHAIFTLDAAGRITSWNRAAQATTGFRAVDIIGRHLSALYPENDRRAGLAAADLRHANATGLHRTEGRRLRANGEAVPASTVFYLVAEPECPLTGYVVITRDITVRTDLENLQEERAAGRKSETLGRLAEGMIDRFADVLAAIEIGQAGGCFTVERVPGASLTLTFTQPALTLAPVAAATAAIGARTVLLVDDDANVLSLVGEMLTYLGHKVVPAQDGAEALRQLRDDRSIDSLFTDIVMPSGMNGVDLMRQARVTRPGLKTLLASVRSREDVQELGDIPQDVAFFAKPYALTDINAYLMA